MKSSANKTPYEIRLDLLQLAFDILANKSVADTDGNGSKVEAPTTEDVVREAEKLNAFVSKAATPSD